MLEQSCRDVADYAHVCARGACRQVATVVTNNDYKLSKIIVNMLEGALRSPFNGTDVCVQ